MPHNTWELLSQDDQAAWDKLSDTGKESALAVAMKPPHQANVHDLAMGRDDQNDLSAQDHVCEQECPPDPSPPNDDDDPPSTELLAFATKQSSLQSRDIPSGAI